MSRRKGGYKGILCRVCIIKILFYFWINQITFRYFPDQTAKFATVEENAKAGSLVAAITVTDQDKGGNGKTELRITSGNEFGHFRLDSRGDIHIVRVQTELDRETTRKLSSLKTLNLKRFLLLRMLLIPRLQISLKIPITEWHV